MQSRSASIYIREINELTLYYSYIPRNGTYRKPIYMYEKKTLQMYIVKIIDIPARYDAPFVMLAIGIPRDERANSSGSTCVL